MATNQSIRLLAGDKQRGETTKAIRACNDFLRMGAGRTIAELQRNYKKINNSEKNAPPTTSRGTLDNWSSRYDWTKRAAMYDARTERQKNEKAKESMQTGLALTYNRVDTLKMVADKLLEDIKQNGIYRKEIKMSARGDTAEYEVLNEPLLRQLRGILEDIAKETGGRIHKTEYVEIDMSKFTPPMLKRVAMGDSPLHVLLDTIEPDGITA